MTDPICRECNREPCVCAMIDKAVSDAAWESEHGPTESREHTEEWFAKRGLVLRTRAEWEELKQRAERAEALARCGCGDSFTEHDPGTCGNCLAGMTAGADDERAALDAESGRVSVPIEPSEAMLDAGYRAEAEDGTPRDIWIAMLAAAQEGSK